MEHARVCMRHVHYIKWSILGYVHVHVYIISIVKIKICLTIRDNRESKEASSRGSAYVWRH